MEGVDAAEGLSGTVLVIGFGRFGQVVSQPLLALGFRLSIIDTDTEAIRVAADYGFKVYYGDGSRLDILHAAGAGSAELVVYAADDQEAGVKLAEIMRADFPLVPVLARSFDRQHSLLLTHAGVGWQIRETWESAIETAREALGRLGVSDSEIAEALAAYRRSDAERYEPELVGGLDAGRGFLRGNIERAETS